MSDKVLYNECKEVQYTNDTSSPVLMSTTNNLGIEVENLVVGGRTLRSVIHGEIPNQNETIEEITTASYTPDVGKNKTYRITLSDALKKVTINLLDADGLYPSLDKYYITGKVDKNHSVIFKTRTSVAQGAKEHIMNDYGQLSGPESVQIKEKGTVTLEVINHSISGEHPFKYLIKHPKSNKSLKVEVVDSVGTHILAALIPGYVLEGHTLALGDTFILPAQTNTSENGVYFCGADGPHRQHHFPVGTDMSGEVFSVLKGPGKANKSIRFEDGSVIGGDMSFILF